MAPWLNWIEQPPPKGQVGGSNPPWVTILTHKLQWVKSYPEKNPLKILKIPFTNRLQKKINVIEHFSLFDVFKKLGNVLV